MSQPASPTTIKLLIINPGSTSTKLALYQGEPLPSADAYRDPEPLWSATAHHSAEQLAQFSHIADRVLAHAPVPLLLLRGDSTEAAN